MTVVPVVAIAGAAGAVGTATARAVARLVPDAGIRLGARQPHRLRPLVDELGPRAAAVGLDVTVPGELGRFSVGCRVLVNCVGSLAGDRIGPAVAAWRGGADYIDPGGDHELVRALSGMPSGGRTGIVAAGVMPGLTGLVPRWLAGLGLRQPLCLTAYVATLDQLTPASAAEFLLSLTTDGSAGASWRGGARVRGDLEPIPRAELPFFPAPATAYPHLSAETEWIARSLQLAEVRWYHLFDPDGYVLPALSRLAQRLRQGAPLGELADELCRAARLELLARQPLQQLVFQLSGTAEDGPGHRVAVLRATSTYELTATVTALAVAAVLAGTVPAGVHHAAAVLDPALVPGLAGLPGVSGWHLFDAELPSFAAVEQGAL